MVLFFVDIKFICSYIFTLQYNFYMSGKNIINSGDIRQLLFECDESVDKINSV